MTRKRSGGRQVMSPVHSRKKLTPAEEVAAIEAGLGYRIFNPVHHYWLDTKSKRLNGVFGSEEHGIPYGRMVELYGPESYGKSLIMLFLMARAQEDGAKTGLVDLERTHDPEWARAQGVDPDKIYLFGTKIGRFGQLRKKRRKQRKSEESDGEEGSNHEAEPRGDRLQTAEELLEVVEVWMARKHAEDPDSKLFLALDSVAAILAEDEATAGISRQNMHTNNAQATLMSKVLKRWAGLAANYNALIIFVNQVRTKPGVAFGDPTYTPGGKALKFYSSIRVSVSGIRGSRIMDKHGGQIGLRGILKNKKNKAGGGSKAYRVCGFETYFYKKKWRFPAMKSDPSRVF